MPLNDLAKIKEQIVRIEDIEGSVVYHLSSNGATQLEKAKAGGYVVRRAIREKMKRFLFGRAKSGVRSSVRVQYSR